MNKNVIALIVITIFCILFLGIEKSYARYISSKESVISVQTAIAITEKNNTSSFSIKLDDMLPGYVKNYTFDITNFIEEDITEVLMNYKISILKSNNIPVDIKLYKNNSIQNVLDSNNECTNNYLSHDIKQTDSYKLEISWEEGENSAVYAGLTDYIDIYITSKQVLETN